MKTVTVPFYSENSEKPFLLVAKYLSPVDGSGLVVGMQWDLRPVVYELFAGDPEQPDTLQCVGFHTMCTSRSQVRWFQGGEQIDTQIITHKLHALEEMKVWHLDRTHAVACGQSLITYSISHVIDRMDSDWLFPTHKNWESVTVARPIFVDTPLDRKFFRGSRKLQYIENRVLNPEIIETYKSVKIPNHMSVSFGSATERRGR